MLQSRKRRADLQPLDSLPFLPYIGATKQERKEA